jgi:hypothetical protein
MQATRAIVFWTLQALAWLIAGDAVCRVAALSGSGHQEIRGCFEMLAALFVLNAGKKLESRQ